MIKSNVITSLTLISTLLVSEVCLSAADLNNQAKPQEPAEQSLIQAMTKGAYKGAAIGGGVGVAIDCVALPVIYITSKIDSQIVGIAAVLPFILSFLGGAIGTVTSSYSYGAHGAHNRILKPVYEWFVPAPTPTTSESKNVHAAPKQDTNLSLQISPTSYSPLQVYAAQLRSRRR